LEGNCGPIGITLGKHFMELMGSLDIIKPIYNSALTLFEV
jgi:hypothetical protein